jgi:hypothetical protein
MIGHPSAPTEALALVGKALSEAASGTFSIERPWALSASGTSLALAVCTGPGAAVQAAQGQHHDEVSRTTGIWPGLSLGPGPNPDAGAP